MPLHQKLNQTQEEKNLRNLSGNLKKNILKKNILLKRFIIYVIF